MDAKDDDVSALADELFRLVEESQGYFFVSDGEWFPTKEQFFERVRGRLQYGRNAVRLMESFLKRHNQL